MLDQVTVDDLLEKEGVKKECKAMLLRSKVKAIESKAYLTPQRLVVKSVKPNKVAGMFGLLGGLIYLFQEKKYEIVQLNIELKEITEAKQGKFGINKNVLEVTTSAGETHIILVDNYPSWQEALNSAMAQ